MAPNDLSHVATLDTGGSRGPAEWIDWNVSNYADYGFGLCIIETHSGVFIGECGLTMQQVEGDCCIATG